MWHGDFGGRYECHLTEQCMFGTMFNFILLLNNSSKRILSLGNKSATKRNIAIKLKLNERDIK